MGIEVVCFRKSDIDTVFAIQQAAYKPLYEKYHDDGSNPYKESKETVLRKYTRAGTKGYLIMKDGFPVGALRIAIETNSARVCALCVLPQYQGQKIAQQALLIIEQRHSGITRWFLDTILEEPGNCHLYEKVGYEKTGRTETINPEMTLVYYEKIKEC